MGSQRVIRVLVVDDSAAVRTMICGVLKREPDMEVVGTAEDGRDALEQIKALNPDIVTMDVEMPRMNGIQVLQELRRKGIMRPVIVFSSLTQRGAAAALAAMAEGASDFVTKPAQAARIQDSLTVLRKELTSKIRQHAAQGPSPTRSSVSTQNAHSLRASASGSSSSFEGSSQRVPSGSRPPPKAEAADGAQERVKGRTDQVMPRTPVQPSASSAQILVVGCSTGGPDALGVFLKSLPPSFALPIAIVQHMPKTFTAILARRLDRKCSFEVIEARGEEGLVPGRVLLAQGGVHMGIRRDQDQLRVFQSDTASENSCRPAVDFLFRSAAKTCGSKTIALVMTGMGADGALGAKCVRAAGGMVLIQDEASSVIWGMPGSVAAAGVADEIVPLSRLGARVAELSMGLPASRALT